MGGLIEDKDLTPRQLACKPRVFKQCGYTVEEFDSLVQMKEWLDAAPLDEKFCNRSYNRSFTQIADTYEKEKERVIFGNRKLTDSVGKILSDVELGTLDAPVGVSMGVEGCVYDMGAVLSGIPECCVQMDSPSDSRVIDIYVDIGYCGGVSAERINIRTIAIMKLINQLVLQKVVVNFHLAHFTTVDGDYNLGTIITLNGLEGLVPQMAYLCSPSFFRVVSWNLNEIRCGINGGSARSMPSDKLIKSIEETGGFYIPGGYVDSFWEYVNTQDEADSHLMESYNKFLERRKEAA